MNQYCRYCVFCFDICDIYGCSNHPDGKEPIMSRKQINRKNNCPNFALSNLGDVETGKPYRPLNKARITSLTKSDKEKQITIDEVRKNDYTKT